MRTDHEDNKGMSQKIRECKQRCVSGPQDTCPNEWRMTKGKESVRKECVITNTTVTKTGPATRGPMWGKWVALTDVGMTRRPLIG